MTLIFYDKEIAHTDEIDFENFTSRFAYEFQCDGYDNITYVESLLSISINHVTVNTTSGNRIKTRKTLNSPHCTMSNFYNEFNASFDTNNFNEDAKHKNTYHFNINSFIDGDFNTTEPNENVVQPSNENNNIITNIATSVNPKDSSAKKIYYKPNN